SPAALHCGTIAKGAEAVNRHGPVGPRPQRLGKLVREAPLGPLKLNMLSPYVNPTPPLIRERSTPLPTTSDWPSTRKARPSAWKAVPLPLAVERTTSRTVMIALPAGALTTNPMPSFPLATLSTIATPSCAWGPTLGGVLAKVASTKKPKSEWCTWTWSKVAITDSEARLILGAT